MNPEHLVVKRRKDPLPHSVTEFIEADASPHRGLFIHFLHIHHVVYPLINILR